MATNASSGSQKEDTDLGSLWKQAIDKYIKDTGHDLSRLKAQSISDIKKAAESDAQSFEGFRHKGDKADKVRSAFGDHMDAMQKCWKGVEMVGAAAGAFPPAMPVGIVFAACGNLLSAFASVSAEYDKVQNFFLQSSRFFERLSLIEGKTSDAQPLRKAIVRVFSTQLSICGLVENRTKQKAARFKQWLSALWNMDDPDLASAYANLQACIDELGDTVGFASYAAIKSTQEVALSVSSKTDEIDANIRRFRSEQREDVQLLYERSLHLEARITEEFSFHRAHTQAGFDRTEAVITMNAERQDQSLAKFQANLETTIKKALTEKSRVDDQEKDKRKQMPKGSGKGDVGDKKFKAVRSIKAFFDEKSDVFLSWRDAHKETSAQHQDVQESYVNGTGEWLASDSVFQQWTQGTNPVLWLTGSEGIGKSFLAYATLRKLASQADGHTSVAYFFFKEDFPYLQSAQNAFACAALQVAESNTRYAESVAAKLKEDGETSKDLSTWHRFFLSPFARSSQGSDNPSPSGDHLYLIFDGLDEAQEQQKEVISQFLADLSKANSRVRVLVTSRPEAVPPVERLNPLTIAITKAKILHDIRIVIWDRLNSLARLNKFSLAAKRFIRRKVSRQADGMLYVEHILRRLSYIGREGAVRKELEKMPANLHELYKLMLDDCRRNRTTEQYDALKKLFAWLAFSKRSLSLAEASELVKLTIGKSDFDFDVEDEIIGRSSRILELSRTRNLDDDDLRDDVKDDDDEENTEDREAALDEYRNASLTFQERSLRQYFKAVSVESHGEEELRTPAATAHFTILSMCIDILLDSAKVERGGDYSTLSGYAVKYWYEHFSEINPEAASTGEVSHVLTALYRITSNENNVAQLFEQRIYASDVYPKSDGETSQPWYERLMGWTAQLASLPASSLGPEVDAWAREISANPKSVLDSLAQGHIMNWLAHYDEWFISEAYRFAEAALKITGHFKEVKDDPEKQILAVADAYEAKEKDAKAMRAIGTRLFYYAMESSESDDRKEKLHTDAIRYIKNALDMMDDDPFEKGATFLILGYLYPARKEYKNSVEYLDKALTTFSQVQAEPGSAMRHKLDDLYRPYYLCLLKADYSNEAGDKDTAMAMYHEARKLAGEEGIGSYWLDKMTHVLDEKTDLDGHRLMDMLKSWTEKDRNTWFEGCLQYSADIEALETMYRAAKLTSESGVVLEWLNVFEKTLAPRSLILFNLKAALADYYRRVLGDVEKAKEAMRTALNLQPKVDGSEEDVLNLQISEVRMDLAGIIFSQFRHSSDPARKETLLEEMKSLPGMKTDDEFRESHIGMLVANMLRIMGPAREYQKCMNDIFKTCIDGLEDSVSWNDGDSLRLLAKVLSSLDGLEHDARITISAQFSVMDRTIFDGSEAGSKASSVNGEPEAPTENGEVAEGTATEDGEVDGKPIVVIHGDHAEPGAAKSTPTITSTSGTQDLDSSPPDEDSSNSSQESTINGNRETQTTPDTEATPLPDEAVPKPADDQDIGDFSIFCDGKCGRSIKQWTEPFYLCLICPNTDLCEECHAKRSEWNVSASTSNQTPSSEPDSDSGLDTTAEAPTSWTTFCGENHHYIKGPMKGWNGIKDGVVRIEDKEFAVKDWIREMKEVRWPKAWERYWLRQGGLKDIDVE